MKNNKSLHIVTFALIAVTVAVISMKWQLGFFQSENFEDGINYRVRYDFDFKTASDRKFSVKAFLPQSDFRQEITAEEENHQTGEFSRNITGMNEVGAWDGTSTDEIQNISYGFDVRVYPVHYSIDPSSTLKKAQNTTSPFVRSSAFIESNHPNIIELATALSANRVKTEDVVTALFNRVYNIPSQSIKELMTASETLEKNAASCNGKSRLFVALCRSLGLPARVVGGLVLNEEKKRTSHLWSEVLIGDDWIPFDPHNGYFAFLPVNYLRIYTGDEFLLKHSGDMRFDYGYTIDLMDEQKTFLETFNLFHISNTTGISTRILSLLILLPLGALIVAIFRNVIGVKTLGVFLPVLIAISFTSTGFIFGLVSFVTVLLFISLLHFPLVKWGILHVPKLVVMLSAVVFLMIVLFYAGSTLNLVMISGLTFFPVVIMTISAEKYARIVLEEGFKSATKILGQTLLVTLFCFSIVNSKFVFLLLMNFPEIILLIIVGSLTLGKWIGLRISEYRRFHWLIS